MKMYVYISNNQNDDGYVEQTIVLVSNKLYEPKEVVIVDCVEVWEDEKYIEILLAASVEGEEGIFWV